MKSDGNVTFVRPFPLLKIVMFDEDVFESHLKHTIYGKPLLKARRDSQHKGLEFLFRVMSPKR